MEDKRSSSSKGMVGGERARTVEYKKAKSDFVKCVRICLIIPQVTIKSLSPCHLHAPWTEEDDVERWMGIDSPVDYWRNVC